MAKLTKEQLAQMYRAECELGETAALLDLLGDEIDDMMPGEGDEPLVQALTVLREAHEAAYGAMCQLANLRVELDPPAPAQGV